MRHLTSSQDVDASPPASWLHWATVPLDGTPVRFAIATVEDPLYDPEQAPGHVLVRVRGFSLNYRDRALIPLVARPDVPSGPAGLGSEFVGEVIAVGAGCERVRVGERVIGEMAWPTSGIPQAPGGVPTNAASSELLTLFWAKLVPVPPQMPDEVAAAFALGAQTAYAMVRRLDPRPGENVLVTAATSNTSLFVIQALRLRGANVFAATCSAGVQDRLRALGAGEVLELASRGDIAPLEACSRRIGGFDGVVDPFADTYLPVVVQVMGFFSRYVTCGVAGQRVPDAPLDAASAHGWAAVLPQLILRNATVTGNCLGLKQDLERALQDWESGRLQVVIDSVHRGDQVASFVERTFTDPDRFGKVVYLYR